MKRLIFILSFLICFVSAFSQTKYTLAYDTVIVQKPSFGYLKAFKGNFSDSLWHRITIALSDSSKLAATTEWVKRQNYGSGGGGGTPGGNYGAVQINRNGVFAGTDSLKYLNSSLILRNKDSVGEIFRYHWTTNPLATWVDGTSTYTVTTDGTGTTVNGTPAINLNNFFTYPRNVAVENYTIEFDTKVLAVDHTSFGLAIGTPTSTSPGTGFIDNILMSDTARYLDYEAGINTPTYANTSKTKGLVVVNTGDMLHHKIQKRQRTFTFTTTNTANGTTSRYVADGIFPQVGQPSIYFYSPQQLVNDFVLKYDEVYNAELAEIGNSISWGGVSSTFVNKYYSIVLNQIHGYGVTMCAPAEMSADGEKKIADVLTVHPKVLLYAYGVNDWANSVNIDSFSHRVQRTITPIIAAGIQVVFVNIVPQSAGSVVTFNDTIQAIATRYNCLVADVYTALKGAGTAMQNIYNSGDGIHPNTNGHYQIAQVVYNKIKSLFSYTSSPIIAGLPLSDNVTDNFIVTGEDGQFKIRPNVPDSQYIFNLTSFNSQTTQSANFNITGSGAVGTQLIAEGTGNFGNPDFCVNCSTNPFLSGVTIANKIFTGNFSTGIGAVGSSFSGGIVYFTNDGITAAKIETQTQSLPILFNHTRSASEGLILQSTGDATTGPFYPFIYKSISGNYLTFIDSLGVISATAADGTGFSSDSVAVWKNGKLSAGTVSGGSSLFPTSGTGTATGGVIGDMAGANLQIINTNNFSVAGSTYPGGLISADNSGVVTIGDIDDDVNSIRLKVDDANKNISVNIPLGTFTGHISDSTLYTDSSFVQKAWVLAHTGSSGANTALSNLASVAINTGLLPGTDASIAVGSGSKRWTNLFLSNGGSINWNNGTTTITSTGGSSLAINVDNGLIQVYKSGQASNLQLYNTTITDGLNFKTSPSFEIKTLSNAGNIVMISDAAEKLGVGGTPTSKFTLFGSLATAYTSTATGITLDGTHGTVKVTATGQTITLPTAVGIAGRQYTIKLTAVGSCTIATTSSQTIDASTTYSLASQYKYVTVQSDGANYIVIANN